MLPTMMRMENLKKPAVLLLVVGLGVLAYRHFGLTQSSMIVFDDPQCTLDYINSNSLEQDHPCIVSIIQRQFLRNPVPNDFPYNLDNDEKKDVFYDPSQGQTKPLLKLLGNKIGGFFVECGGADGEFFSNTLLLERAYNWKGVLIEASPINYGKLVTRNRKTWTVPVCLSLHGYPTQVTFDDYGGKKDWVQGIGRIVDSSIAPKKGTPRITVQCFPFYSVMLAIGQTNVDLFSLDIEGHELKVLQTIPWHKITIKTLVVEYTHIPGGKGPLVEFMEKNNFKAALDLPTKDYVFVLNKP